MLELQKMLQENFQNHVLVKQGNDWNVWFTGEDWQKSEAEVAELDRREKEDPFDFVERSFKIARVVAEPDGAISRFDLAYHNEAQRSSLTVIPGLKAFLRALELVWAFTPADDADVNVRFGCMVDAVVLAYDPRHYWSGERYPVRVGRFTHDPKRDVLTHRV
ncbi:MAG TPA: hypothetical protein VFO38_03370 [Candidatus Saccharimonadales bacterium]|nr:hypothetical protein [Candidatus Saccharimonadales bacterium]